MQKPAPDDLNNLLVYLRTKMTNQVKYDRNKDRQGLFKEDFFKTSYSENLQLLQEWIEESKSDSTIPSDALPQQLYLTMLTEYTACRNQ